MIMLIFMLLASEFEGYEIGKIMICGNIKTRERIIRQELLFKEGDLYDKEKIDESERNLRNFAGFSDVEIISEKNNTTGFVDIVVKVKEVWCIYPIPIPPQGGGGNLTVGAFFVDMNFLGLNQCLFLIYTYQKKEKVDHIFGVSFNEPRLLGSRYTLGMSYFKGTTFADWSLNLDRPLYSRWTKWGESSSIGNSHGNGYWYDEANNWTEYTIDSRWANFDITRSFGEKFKRDFTLGYIFDSKNYSSDSISIPDRYLSGPTFSIKLNYFDYMKETLLDELGKTEDIPIGYKFDFSLTPYAKLFYSDRNELSVSVDGSVTQKFLTNQYIKLNLHFESDGCSDSTYNTVATVESYYYVKAAFYQTFCLHSLLRYINDLEPPSQYRLGGANGLRGYKANGFGGEKEFLFNIEDRIKIIQTPWIVVGGVIFFDYGGFSATGSKRAIGAGIRFYFPKFFCPIIRIDYAHPLDTDKPYHLNFGINQSFTITPPQVTMEF